MDPIDDNEAPYVSRHRVEWCDGVRHERDDHIAHEAPLEIRVAGVPLAVLMRTPGHDEDLVRGFLVSEGIATPSQIASARHCDTIDDPALENSVMQVVLCDGVDVSAHRRNFYASSSCGVCGKASIDHAMRLASPLEVEPRMIDAETITGWPAGLRIHQHAFAATGGLHAAALFEGDTAPSLVREDVGRHNALDKVIGAHRRTGDKPSVVGVMVSGRVSFELVQKALAARIPIVAAVSAPTSLAVSLAQRCGITLIGFVRDRRMCIYSHPTRIHD